MISREPCAYVGYRSRITVTVQSLPKEETEERSNDRQNSKPGWLRFAEQRSRGEGDIWKCKHTQETQNWFLAQKLICRISKKKPGHCAKRSKTIHYRPGASPGGSRGPDPPPPQSREKGGVRGGPVRRQEEGGAKSVPERPKLQIFSRFARLKPLILYQI